MICCIEVEKSYGNYRVLKRISAEFRQTGLYLLSGESGSGKTTFLNILYGLTSFDGGEVRIGNIVYSGCVDRRRMESIAAYIPQDTLFVDFLTMLENLELVKPEISEIHKMCDRYKLNGLLQSFPKQLSGGERQRFAVLRALLFKKDLIFMDEPTSAMDPMNKQIFMEMIEELKNNKLIICASHDPILQEGTDNVIRFLK